MGDAACAGDGECVQLRAANQHGARAQRQGLDDIRSAPDAAVEQERSPALNGGGDGGQGVERRWQRVERAPAVIGDDEAIEAAGERTPGVRRGGGCLSTGSAAAFRA